MDDDDWICFLPQSSELVTDYVTIPSKGVMYVYLLGLAVSNLCVLITAVPALFEMGGVKFAAMGEVNFCAFIVFHKNAIYKHCTSLDK